jgi:hypothetical protein
VYNLPKIVSGCPEKKPYPIPQTNPDTNDSIAAIFLPVAFDSNPPNVIIGDKQAKYKKILKDKIKYITTIFL